MKLRRALAIAAATAVIAPAALLAAPAAYAEEDAAATQSKTGTAAGSQEPGDPAGSAAPAPGASQPEDASGGSGADAPADETPDDESSTDEAPAGTSSTEEEPLDDKTTTNTDTDESEDKDQDKGGSEDDGKDEDEEEDPLDPLPYCEEVDENFEEQALSAELSGLPGKIVAGGGWTDFSLTVTNTSETDLKEVAFYAVVENWEVDESKWLSPHVDLEFRNPVSGQWESIGDDEWAGGYFWGVDVMKSEDFVKTDLRVNIHKNAPAGDSWSFGTGAYLTDIEGQECIAENAGDERSFTVLEPGTGVGNPGEAKPGDGKPEDKGPNPQPQGEVKELPVTGNLAETGSSSMLPTIAAIGGVAMVAGAGAVFVVRRRRTEDMGATA
ncbi:MAG TPA: hypothetical protein DEQ61_09705 [Streptomyces sp.]|nr:hypothetical protein [Streptomyces sp.]